MTDAAAGEPAGQAPAPKDGLAGRAAAPTDGPLGQAPAPPPDATDQPLILAALARQAELFPTEPKLLVCPRSGIGRELLHALALTGRGWIGYSARTPGQIAGELVAEELAADRLEQIDDFERIALLDEAIDEVLIGHGVQRLEELSEMVGFRRAVGRTVGELRNAGVGSLTMARARLDEAPKRDAMAAILAHYETHLAERRQVDTVDIMRRAVEALESGRAAPPKGRILLLPGLHRRGLTGRFLKLLVDAGAVSLDADPVVGLETPAGWIAGDDSAAEASEGGREASNGKSRPTARPRAAAAADESEQLRLLSDDDASAAPPSLAGEGDGGDYPRSGDPRGGDPRGGGRAAAAGARGGRRPVRSRLSFLHDVAAANGAAGPTIEIFAAASPADELREVLRRVVAEGLRWDEVEIVATDRDLYGTILDSIAGHLEIPVTYAAGLPLARSRVGRAVTAWLHWIQEDFPAQILRELLQANVVSVPAAGHVEVSGPALARRLRRLRIGWNRHRYLRQIERRLEALEVLEAPIADDEDAEPEEREAARARERAELEALKQLLGALLEAAPEVGDRLGTRPVRVSPAAIATGLLALLEFVPARRPVAVQARHRLRERLARIAATLHRETAVSSALAVLRHHLEGIRIPSPAQPGRLPWSSAGGALHLSDLENGALSGRRRTFVVGLDTSRFPGPLTQDPLLLDGDRRRLAADGLPTTVDMLAERRWSLATLLARLRGTVTLSYSAWDAVEGRTLAPASVVLQALRLKLGDPSADYERLRRETGGLRGPLPDGAPLDRRDVWFGNLASGSLLLDAREVVRQAHPRLSRGLEAMEQRRQAETATAYWGLIEPRPAELDPRRDPQMLVSASRLETLGRCPLRYFYRYVLDIQPPEELDADLGAWLDPRERGKLLHGVYEEIVDRGRELDLAPSDPAFRDMAIEILEAHADRHQGRVPAPSEAIFENELRELRADLDVFLRMLDEEEDSCLVTELRFGFPDAEHDAVELHVEGGTIKLRGAIDRVDEGSDGTLQVVDYKTGSNRSYSARKVWAGGRRLQHALYTVAAERLLGRAVRRMAYHFPTRKGAGETVAYDKERLERWPILVRNLLGVIERGHFLPTEEAGDCRYCDHAAACRVEIKPYGTESPPARWAAAHLQLLEEYELLRKVRRADE